MYSKIHSRLDWFFGYIGEPEEVSELALFLASNNSNFLTGQVIIIDGGRSILNRLEKAAY